MDYSMPHFKIQKLLYNAKNEEEKTYNIVISLSPIVILTVVIYESSSLDGMLWMVGLNLVLLRVSRSERYYTGL